MAGLVPAIGRGTLPPRTAFAADDGHACRREPAAHPVRRGSHAVALLARRAIGRVEQLTQAPKGEQPGFDVATVILNADAAKVYATAIRLLHKNQTVHVDAEDATLRTVQSRLSQILVASVTKPGQTSATMRVVDGIVRVCQEMKVSCSVR